MKRVIFLALNLMIFFSVAIMVSGIVCAQAYNPMRIAGEVTAYQPADCGKDGSITIAGVKLAIAAGTDVAFVDRVPLVQRDGTIQTTTVRSEPWQVVGTGRLIDVYLDPQGRIRQQINTMPPTTTRTLEITGIVNGMSAGSITINNISFPVAAGMTVAATPNPNNLVRIGGSLNNSGELSGTVTVSTNPYRTLRMCGAPAQYRTIGVLFVSDDSPFDPAGPITEVIGSQLLCDNSLEAMTVDGAATIISAPNFSIRQEISKDVDACYELQIDQFGLMTNGSKRVFGTGNKISGILEAYAPAYTGPFPTERNEMQQRGRIRISGVTYTIAPGNAITIDPSLLGSGGDVQTGVEVCIAPVVDSAGSTAPFLAGMQAPSRALQLIRGTTVSKTCP